MNAVSDQGTIELDSKTKLQTKPFGVNEKFSESVEKPFKCTTCSMCFKLKHQLNKHPKTHSEVKSFKCNTCQKIYSSASKGNAS